MTRISLIFKYPNIYKVKHKEKVQYMQFKLNGPYSDIMQNLFGWHNRNRFHIMCKYDPYSNMYKNNFNNTLLHGPELFLAKLICHRQMMEGRWVCAGIHSTRTHHPSPLYINNFNIFTLPLPHCPT